MLRSLILFLVFGLLNVLVNAQDLSIPRNIQATFKKGSRSPDGKPGRNYWQNTADYTLHVNFFPRIAVYDDIDGWNRYPYLGSQEFYNDFCNFDVHIAVPKNYVVWATGELQNGNEVFNPKIYQRIQEAEKSDAIVTIFDSTDN